MRAAFYERNGAARDVLRVGEVDTPEPGPGEVRVRLRTSGVNPSDVKSRQGVTRKIAFPRVIPHSDGAGVIERVGAGVPAARAGERVWIWNGQWKRPFGTAAEFIVVPAAQAVRLPDGTDFAAGACFGIPLLTAHHAVARAEPGPGRRVLVQGGAGAVSHYAIQLAKLKGATVLATVSSEAKAAHARAAGADHAIDYRREDVAARVKELTDGAGVDSVIEVDFAANANTLPALIRPKGQIVVYGTGLKAELSVQPFLANSLRLAFIFVYELDADARATAIAELTALLEKGALIHTIGARFPLDAIVAAHEAVEQGALGNVVIDLA